MVRLAIREGTMDAANEWTDVINGCAVLSALVSRTSGDPEEQARSRARVEVTRALLRQITDTMNLSRETAGEIIKAVTKQETATNLHTGAVTALSLPEDILGVLRQPHPR
jgi:hypothetical protein